MGTIANAKVTHYYNCYNGDFIGCLRCLQHTLCIIQPLIQLRFSHYSYHFTFTFHIIRTEKG